MDPQNLDQDYLGSDKGIFKNSFLDLKLLDQIKIMEMR